MLTQILVIALVPALLALAGAWDLTSFTIPNRLSLALAGLFAVFAVSAHLSLDQTGGHLVAGLAGLVLGFALFALGWIGGGDAKLFAATAMWLGFSDFLPYALAASLFGGALTLGLLFLRKLPLPATLAGQDWVLRLHDARAGIPYGVALAAGGLAVLPHSAVLRLALQA